MSKRLKDYVIESNQAEVRKNLEKITKKCRFIIRWIDTNVPRTGERVILCNLLGATADYLELAKSSLNSHISALALSTRSVYEINVRLRSLLENPESLNQWQSEAVTDKVQVLEGILTLANGDEKLAEQNMLKQEIERLKGLVDKYGLPTVKQPTTTGNLAKTVGMEDEHAAMFKLYSKLVHPSSYLVNDHSASSIENQKTLQIHAQLNAHDSISRVCEKLGVPFEVSKPYGQE
ncbi:DUF5677 domain-containing protein [Pseudomonas syringae]|uniref:DUF5677 domain-containing protein n=1 Tax=Pseudomonas syringae TaxID=317 RepID=UPI00215B4F8A|nr:DUF5677 domain-containing protein [Pseudomonas syringae]MCR8718251.1 DUF5677 domain-containing protein [Pseudomonas syringae]